ncbi:hypothetical protein J416_14877 [Gracilibacillus halophilus YIM-C55.5]|uniref:DUF4367 domain-containing protein n=1 Tax=Gracilibacillus halophilus YIM-C55.5 TaxID=1308866 RepID=N4WR28_9BACI|nr:hypothetical protein [Gracilibacillus halophilus]ENH95676.1 hypothetical protein J416_14877 [Gracilibacillus halophilus YIM-C55.5]
MNNKLKRELQKIEIPKQLHERAKMGVDKAKSERPKRKVKNPLVAAAVVSLLVIGSLFTSPIQAALEGIFEVSKYEESSKQESISFGSGISEIGVMGQEVYTSLKEMEETYNMNIPFPEKIWEINPQSNQDKFRVGVDGDGDFISYNFNLATEDKTHEQSFSIKATKSSEAKVNFHAETEDGTAINKDITINDTKAKLFGVDELAYSIYIEKNGWKFIITMVEKNDELRTEFTRENEKQLIELAESIQ